MNVGLGGFRTLAQLATVGNIGGNERGAVPDALRDSGGERLALRVIVEGQVLRGPWSAPRRSGSSSMWAPPMDSSIAPRSPGTRGSNRRRLIVPAMACVCSSVVSTGSGVASPFYQATGGGSLDASRGELAIGTDLNAPVTRVMPSGAFASVPMGIAGLVHISEIASRRISSPTEVVHPGDLVRVRVVAIDPERRRLSVSVRQAAGNVVYATRTDQDANV